MFPSLKNFLGWLIIYRLFCKISSHVIYKSFTKVGIEAAQLVYGLFFLLSVLTPLLLLTISPCAFRYIFLILTTYPSFVRALFIIT